VLIELRDKCGLQLSADGPSNLYNAVSVAICKEAHDRGVLVAFNDRIFSAYYVSKVRSSLACISGKLTRAQINSTALDAFQSHEAGAVGYLLNSEPHFWYEPSRPTHKLFFGVDHIETLPHVPIFYAYQDSEMDSWIVQHAVDKGAKGIVLGRRFSLSGRTS
jgi:L-asparaginase